MNPPPSPTLLCCSVAAITLAAVKREYETGKGFVCNHPDMYGRPVVFIRGKRHIIGAARRARGT